MPEIHYSSIPSFVIRNSDLFDQIRLPSITFHHFVSGVESSWTVACSLLAQLFVFRHAQLLFYLVQRLAFARHLADTFNNRA